ncbi:hypothetical protein K525DRAFT_214674 [Schizophyllum commune Loenen D]|nr:hypothetical protein K525DRAFT_214674 [Schizophyllum commune Loenen D]
MKEEPTATCPSPPKPLKRVGTFDRRDDPLLETVHLGVWTLTLGREKVKAKSKWPFPSLGALHSHFALVRRIFSEVWLVDPWAVTFLVLYHFFEAIEYSIILYFSGRLLKQIELVLVSGTVDKAAILSAIVARLSCFAFVVWARWWNHTTMPRLRSRVIRHFKTNLLSGMSSDHNFD